MSEAIGKALDYVRLADKGETDIGIHKDWPEIDSHENGMPWVREKYDAPKNYADAIRGLYSALSALGGGKPAPDFRKESRFLSLLEYIKEDPTSRRTRASKNTTVSHRPGY